MTEAEPLAKAASFLTWRHPACEAHKGTGFGVEESIATKALESLERSPDVFNHGGRSESRW